MIGKFDTGFSAITQAGGPFEGTRQGVEKSLGHESEAGFSGFSEMIKGGIEKTNGAINDFEKISNQFAQGEKINTGLHKLGAIVGDGAQVGCNCVLNPGTVLGKNSFCFPCLNIYGFVPENGKVKPAMKNIVE